MDLKNRVMHVTLTGLANALRPVSLPYKPSTSELPNVDLPLIPDLDKIVTESEKFAEEYQTRRNASIAATNQWVISRTKDVAPGYFGPMLLTPKKREP